MITGDQLGLLAVGLVTLVGTIYSARSARRTNTVTVDVRIFEALQEDVVRLQERVEKLREAVRVAEDETDRERRLRRNMSSQVESLADLVERLNRALGAAGVEVPAPVTSYMNFPRPHNSEGG